MDMNKNNEDLSPKIPTGSFAIPLTSLSNATGSWRSQRPVYSPSDAPCHLACPAHEEISSWLGLMASGNTKAAWEKLIQSNPLPAISGRVCPHPCESSCHRGSYDNAVGIHHVERTLGDLAIKKGWSIPVLPLDDRLPPVAVVGAGPSGLSAAYQLRKKGYRVTLFEALSEAGGTCRSAIPSYRLDKKVLESEVSRLLSTGILFRPNQRLGRDFSLEELEADYGACFLGPGAQKSRDFDVGGAAPPTLRHGLDLLKEYQDIGQIPRWNKAVIVGGGNTAMDLARVLLRTGTSEVHIITEESLPTQENSQKDQMPGNPQEIAKALEEGVMIHPNRAVRRLVLQDDRIIGVQIVHARKGQLSGAPHRESFEGTESLMMADQIIPAVGQVVSPEGIENIIHRGMPHLSVDKNGFVTGSRCTFSAGDACPGGGTVSHAIGSAHLAALAMDDFLSKGALPAAAESAQPISFERLNLHYFEPITPVEGPRVLKEALSWEEAEESFTEELARKEANRCLSCGACLHCDNCWTLCPDNAVLKTTGEETGSYVLDYGFCKGCGICAHECPTGFIKMVSEP
ncbi:FAD-dependent oxidoreductase [Leptospirillum ferrooxidans]|jgi:2-oxoacid:acceptor oxidoreductase delta subunit (pyruvate/2-ketoisovalerate family)|uniref:Putative NADPH-dependent glutamate synthase beta chain n=1 Tax=Leptospirillum ferrooxidans (strain C2-3) TaxID=1162668 RepID=I0IKH2_LEPFC|nr:FAD-dependent oxidoreductase [Leptospirillum ferrooxidans]BAM05771.1 putative NADPH-dependent glutamate synthase beta chain [Leptospirillum ferrooxidans C2-3]